MTLLIMIKFHIQFVHFWESILEENGKINVIFVRRKSKWWLKSFAFSSKLCISSALKTHMNHEPFCFWADWVLLCSIENTVILLKYPIFDCVLFMILWTKNRVPVHCSVCTKKLIKIKMRKLIEFFWDFSYLSRNICLLDTIQDFFSNFRIKLQLNWVKNSTFP